MSPCAVSLPPPESIRSAPPRPSRVSALPKPFRVSAPGLPTSVFGPEFPFFVTARAVAHIAATSTAAAQETTRVLHNGLLLVPRAGEAAIVRGAGAGCGAAARMAVGTIHLQAHRHVPGDTGVRERDVPAASPLEHQVDRGAGDPESAQVGLADLARKRRAPDAQPR